MALEQYSFGAGMLYLVPQGIAVPQPVQIGTLQDTSVDLSWTDKPLQGQYDAPVAIARGGLKLTGKIKAGKVRAADFNALVFGATTSTGSTTTADGEGLPTGSAIPTQVTLNTSAQTTSGSVLTFAATTGVVNGMSINGTNIPAGAVVSSHTATTVTMSVNVSGTVANAAAIVFGPSVTVINAATFVADLGVINVATGAQMTRVASAPAAGQYTVAAGVYSFSTADAASGVYVAPSYSYTQSTGGTQFTYYKQLMGPRPVFQMILKDPYFGNNPNYAGQPWNMTIFAAGMNKFLFDFKNEDWNIPELDFSAQADFLGRVCSMGLDA